MITVNLHDPTGEQVTITHDKQGQEVFYTLTLTEHQMWAMIDQALPQLHELNEQRHPMEPILSDGSVNPYV